MHGTRIPLTRRARRLAAGAAVAAALLLVGGCATGTTPGGGDDTSTRPPVTVSPEPSDTAGPLPTDVMADLTITLDETGTGASTQTWSLTCQPAGGDHPDPDAACAALLAAGGAAAFTPTPRDAMCTEIYGGPQLATVTGTVDGTTIDATFSRTNGCEISRWEALVPLLGSAGGV